MPPGMPWAYGQSMSMRNPMSRAPMNNNPMGVQAPMTPNYGAASGAAATFQPLPYAGRALGVAGPASAVGGMMAGQSAMSRPAPRPQGSPYMRAMSGDPIYGQNGIGVQRSAQNVLMGQPMDADTRMRGLNMPGMQFNPSRGAMVQNQRTPLTVNPDQQRWGRMNNPSIGGGAPIDGATQRANTRIARAGRMAGVRAGDMAQWRATSPAALAIARNAMPQLQHPGPPGKVPAQMGEQMAGPPRPPAAIQPIQIAENTIMEQIPAQRQSPAASQESPARQALRSGAANGMVESAITRNAATQNPAGQFGNMAKYASAARGRIAENLRSVSGFDTPYALGGYMPHWSQSGIQAATARQENLNAAIKPRPIDFSGMTPEGEDFAKKWRNGEYTQMRTNLPFGSLSGGYGIR